MKKICFGILKTLLLLTFLVNSERGNAAEKQNEEIESISLIKRRRLALFWQTGFPSESPRSPQWYRRVLEEAGLEVTVIGVKDITDAEAFCRKRFDTLILATGGNIPRDAGYNIDLFMREGGNVLIDGHIMLGKETDGGKLFVLNEQEDKWIPSRHILYNSSSPDFFLPGFQLIPWPCHASTAPVNRRPLDENLMKNPVLAGVLPDCPDEIEPEPNFSTVNGVLRMVLPGGCVWRASVNPPEFANDVILPLYIFKQPSGFQYPYMEYFPDAGNSKKDCDSDFYVVRYHNLTKNGSTLMHFGRAGAKLLSSDSGEKVLLNVLRLAESALPGERSPEFIENCNTLEKEFASYASIYFKYVTDLHELARIFYYQNAGDHVDKIVKEIIMTWKEFESAMQRNISLCNMLQEGKTSGDEERRMLIGRCKENRLSMEASAETIATKLVSSINPPLEVPVMKTWPKDIYYGLDFIMGRDAPGMSEFKEQIEKMHIRCYGGRPIEWNYDDIWSSQFFWVAGNGGGVLDIESGKVTGQDNYRAFPQNSEEAWMEYMSSFLPRVQNTPGIVELRGLEERDMRWTLWGEWMKEQFVSHLKERYPLIADLNRCWGSTYKEFSEIQLPLCQPRTQVEHALWEDWTRFREIFRIQREVRPAFEAAKKYAPSLPFLPYVTWSQHGRHPANGINFYEFGKMFPEYGYGYTTFEHSNDKYTCEEWFYADIVGFSGPNICPEWGAFYDVIPYDIATDSLKEFLWRGISVGQIGWSFFTFSVPGLFNTNYLTCNNQLLPLGAQLREIAHKFSSFRNIILDGKREAPQVCVVYSPTTRRHTSWPGVADDISRGEVSGYYKALKRMHVSVRAIDEQAVWEGHLYPGNNFLVLPRMSYVNDAMLQKVLDFIRSGGNVLVDYETGKFDQYGYRRDSFLSLAGITVTEPGDKSVRTNDGRRCNYGATNSPVKGFNVLFPEETDILLRFESNEPVLVQTHLGKGDLFVSGILLGDSYNQQEDQSVMSVLDCVLKEAGMIPDFISPDAKLTIQSWIYNGNKYLIITNPVRRDMIRAETQGDEFPFKPQYPLTVFSLKIKGKYKVIDYLLGVNVPEQFDGEYTVVNGMVSAPGGLIYQLIPNDTAAGRITKELRKNAEKNMPGKKNGSNFPGPQIFKGEIFAHDGAVSIGDFSLSLYAKDEKKVYMEAKHNGEILNELCEKNKITKFFFTDTALAVACREVNALYPISIECEITTEKHPLPVSACRFYTEDYLGQKSLIMENGYIKVRILPELGGRIIEFTTMPDNKNHMMVNEKHVCQGWEPVVSSWKDYGGLEINEGKWPGNFWNLKFPYQIIKNTPEEIILLLPRTRTAGADYSLEQKFVLRKSMSALECSAVMYNESKAAVDLKLQLHPELCVGGDADLSDVWCYPGEENPVCQPYQRGKMFTVTNHGDWTAFIDTAKKTAFLETFNKEQVSKMHSWMGDDYYNLELTSEKLVSPGDCILCDYSLAAVKGLDDINAFTEGVGIEISFSEDDIYKQNRNVPFSVTLAGIAGTLCDVAVSIQGPAGTDILESFSVVLTPGAAVSKRLEWVRAEKCDGNYNVLVTVQSEVAGRNFVIKAGKSFSLRGKQQDEYWEEYGKIRIDVEKLRTSYQYSGKNSENLSKEEITRLHILLYELRDNIEKGNFPVAEEMKNKIKDILKSMQECADVKR